MNTDVKISRGEVFYITSYNNTIGSEQKSGRPAVVVSNNSNNEHSKCVEICYLTLQEKPPLPTHVLINSGACINSTVLCEQITTVSVDRLGDYMCRLPDAIMDKIDRACAISIGIDHLVSKSNDVVVKPLSTPDSTATKEAYLQKECESLRSECEELKCAYDRKSVEAEEYKAKAEKADMYEKMYNDLLEKLIRR